MRSSRADLFSDVRRVRPSGLRLRIELSKPSGDLTTRLALPYACPVPLGFPIDPAGVDLTVGSGPYYFSQDVPHKLLVLGRNRYYRGSLPHRVAKIVINFGGDLDSNIRSVEQGQADMLGSEIPADVREVLARRYGVDRRQLFRLPGIFTVALALNTTSPLFRDNLALRKAVNLALDRPGVIATLGARRRKTPPLAGERQDGSDGTRTRDLRRDRPVRGSRRLTTMDAESLYSCGLSGLSRSDSAWLYATDLSRLLPDCCPRCTVREGCTDPDEGRSRSSVRVACVVGVRRRPNDGAIARDVAFVADRLPAGRAGCLPSIAVPAGNEVAASANGLAPTGYDPAGRV